MSVVELPAAVTSLSIPHRLFQPITRDFPPPKISHLPSQGKRGLHRLLSGLVQVGGQGVEHLQQIGAGNGEAPGQGGQGRPVGQEFCQGAVLFIRESVDGPHFIDGLGGNGDMQDGFCPPSLSSPPGWSMVSTLDVISVRSQNTAFKRSTRSWSSVADPPRLLFYAVSHTAGIVKGIPAYLAHQSSC